MIRKVFIGWILRWLDRSLALDYKKIDRQQFENWAFVSADNPGWRSYLAYEDLKLLKELGIPKPDYQYWINIGRRMQLLGLADEMRKSFELKKAAEEKRKAEAEKNKNN